METITHSNVQNSKGYVILFGNRTKGMQKNENEAIQKFWRRAINLSKRLGDVSLHKDGKIIRSCWNADTSILSKGRYKTIYNKH